MQYWHQLLIEELNLISEYKLRNFALDVAGLFPGVGEGADVINAIDLAKQGDYISSAFSLISMIPVAGDVIGKGGKLAMLGSKAAQKTVAVGVAKIMTKAIKFLIFSWEKIISRTSNIDYESAIYWQLNTFMQQKKLIYHN